MTAGGSLLSLPSFYRHDIQSESMISDQQARHQHFQEIMRLKAATYSGHLHKVQRFKLGDLDVLRTPSGALVLDDFRAFPACFFQVHRFLPSPRSTTEHSSSCTRSGSTWALISSLCRCYRSSARFRRVWITPWIIRPGALIAAVLVLNTTLISSRSLRASFSQVPSTPRRKMRV